MMPGADILRAGLVAALAVLTAFALRATLSLPRRRVWVLLLAPYLMPSLLIGYAYSSFSLSLIHHPAANAMAYVLLLVLRLAPVAALALYFAPSPLTAEARHCRRLACMSPAFGFWSDWRFRWQAGCARAPLTAFAVVFLLAFSEFELASLLNIRTWTVRLFDGHAGGLPLAESLALAAGPFLVEVIVLGLALALFARQQWKQPDTPARTPACFRSGWILLVAANLAVVLVPAAIVLHGTLQGWRVLAENFALGSEILTSLLFGVLAAGAAYALAPRRWWLAVTVSVPGLLGPLVLALLIGVAVQSSPWFGLRDTPLPLLAALSLLLLPLAVLLRQLLRRTAPAASVHAARLLGGAPGRRLVWLLSTRRHVWVIFLLFCLAYLDLTAAAILAPIGTAPVSVRLYNLMHYGRTAVLSAMVLAAVAAPLAALAVVLATRRVWMRVG